MTYVDRATCLEWRWSESAAPAKKNSSKKRHPLLDAKMGHPPRRYRGRAYVIVQIARSPGRYSLPSHGEPINVQVGRKALLANIISVPGVAHNGWQAVADF